MLRGYGSSFWQSERMSPLADGRFFTAHVRLKLALAMFGSLATIFARMLSPLLQSGLALMTTLLPAFLTFVRANVPR
ncbi:MAG: hypothetical protein ACJAY5_000634 [Actinomycetes bacterium]